MSVIAKWNKIKDLVMGMEGDVNKVESKQTRASARRARKSLQAVKGLAQELRKELQEAVSS